MSRKVPFECTLSTKNDNLHVTAIGPMCQQEKLCPTETPSLDMRIDAEILASLQGTKVYPHPVERDEKGNVTRKITKKSEMETEK